MQYVTVQAFQENRSVPVGYQVPKPHTPPFYVRQPGLLPTLSFWVASGKKPPPHNRTQLSNPSLPSSRHSAPPPFWCLGHSSSRVASPVPTPLLYALPLFSWRFLQDGGRFPGKSMCLLRPLFSCVGAKLLACPGHTPHRPRTPRCLGSHRDAHRHGFRILGSGHSLGSANDLMLLAIWIVV